MTYIIDETLSDSEFTDSLSVLGTFGVPRRIESITIHHYGSFGQRPEDVVDFFLHRNPNTSAHFVAGSGKVWCLVSPLNAAWAAGNAYGNATSIHIECQPEATDADYDLVAWLVRFLREHYGDLPLKAHREWSATACPGIWDLGRLDREARATGPVQAPPIAAPAPEAVAPVAGAAYEPDDHWRVDKGDTLTMAARHFGVTVAELAHYNGIKDPNRLEVGERIWPPVENGDTWVVEKGDTLAGIVRWYHANGHTALTVQKLQYANGINDPATETSVGLRLQVPA